MAGSIDQVDGVVTFRDAEDNASIVAQWDAQIMNVCLQERRGGAHGKKERDGRDVTTRRRE